MTGFVFSSVDEVTRAFYEDPTNEEIREEIKNRVQTASGSFTSSDEELLDSMAAKLAEIEKANPFDLAHQSDRLRRLGLEYKRMRETLERRMSGKEATLANL